MKNTIHQMLSRIHVLTGKTLSLHDLKLVAKHLTLAENIFESVFSSFTEHSSKQHSHNNTAISVYEKTEEAYHIGQNLHMKRNR